MRFLSLAALALLLVAGSGCDSTDATYPAAGNYPEVSLVTLLGASPGTYNVTAYVTETAVCEVTPVCVGDTIELSESNDNTASTTATLFVDEAGQFETDARYRFSVQVSAAKNGPEENGAILMLLGYSRLAEEPR